MLLPGTVHRVVCSSLELRQALLLNVMPSDDCPGSGQWQDVQKEERLILWIGPPQKTSMVCAAAGGHVWPVQRPCECQGSMLPLEESTVYAAAGCY